MYQEAQQGQNYRDNDSATPPRGVAVPVTTPVDRPVSRAVPVATTAAAVSGSSAMNAAPILGETPITQTTQRALGDRSYDKRKNAALEIESMVRSLLSGTDSDTSMVQEKQALILRIISQLSMDFCTSMNANYRKGGLIGIAAVSIGLAHDSHLFLEALLKPVLLCFDDPESRVRYYACESLYNIVKVARVHILRYFNQIFDGLCKLFADVDLNVKNGANLLDRLIKDIVSESRTFNVEQFIPLLQNYIRRTNPFIRQLLVGWITVLDSVPDVNMIDWLPDFLDGLFNMLSDSNKEIRQAADSALSEFLREIKQSSVVEFGPMVVILVQQCHSKERLNRLTAISWLSEFIYLGGDLLLPFHSDILGAIMQCISDSEVEIRSVAERTNDDLLTVVRDTREQFELSPLLDCLTGELMSTDVSTKMAALRWINMLLEKIPRGMNKFISDLLPVLLKTLSDPSDAVVLLCLQVLSRISLYKAEFKLVLSSILSLFSTEHNLLETRGSLIVRKLCVLLNAKSVYIEMAEVLSRSSAFSLDFVSTMVQILNLVLLTASELHDLRTLLKESFHQKASQEDRKVFISLFNCWCHNPVATFSFCLLAQAYEVAFILIKKYESEFDVTVGFLMQVDKLVQLLESPAFVHLRLQLLDIDSPNQTSLLKSLYGLLMLLPQSDAYRTLNDRLATVCSLKEHIGAEDQPTEESESANIDKQADDMTNKQLIVRFDEVRQLHSTRERFTQ